MEASHFVGCAYRRLDDGSLYQHGVMYVNEDTTCAVLLVMYDHQSVEFLD